MNSGSWRNPRTRTWIALLGAGTLVLATACGGTLMPARAASAAAGSPAAAAAPVHVSVEMGFLPSANQLPFYVALQRGYYKRAGLAVRIVNGKGSGLTVQQVAAGHYDIGQVDLPIMALAVAKGAPLRSFFVEAEENASGVLASKAEGIKTWRDLYGKQVFVSAGSDETFLMPAVFKRLGLNIHRVKLVYVSPANKVREYVEGVGDATAGGNTGAMPVIQPRRPSNALWFADVIRVPDLGLVARRAYIRTHAAVLRAFSAATARGLHRLLDHPSAVVQGVQTMVRDNPGPMTLTPAQLVAGWKIYARFVAPIKGRPLGWNSAREWATTIKVLHAYAGLTGDLHPGDYYTNAYLKP